MEQSMEKPIEVGLQTILFTGIGGIGMSGLAQLLGDRGEKVVGTDRAESPVTALLKEKGIQVIIGQRAENVADTTKILVYSDAVPVDNPERLKAEEMGIPQRSYFEMLGSVSEEKRVVAIAGTHGKTTTTGMLARILRDAGISPTAIVGSLVQDFGSNYLHGDSDFFVVEACEWRRHFLNLSPEILVVTNIEFDHTDYFKDLADVQDAFRTLMQKVPEHGAIITDTEHPNIQPLLQGISARTIDYTSLPNYELRLPGDFNKMNAKAAVAAAQIVMPDIAQVDITESLKEFHGTWRRFQYKGVTKTGATVYDDYAHHPTAVKETTRALRERAKEKHPNGKVIIVFHPHLFSRTRDLFDGFVRAFGDADEVIIAPIFAARETDDGSISSELLAKGITEEGTQAYALETFEKIERKLLAETGPEDTIMTMGAGDIYKVADALAAKTI
jgi:UDP-N-acetylmuramate--alanine ligase